MFNKMKQAIPRGNKKQREMLKDDIDAENAFNADIIKVELRHNRKVHPYIKNTSDHNEFPNYLMRQACWHGPVMTEEERKEDIEWLKKHGIETVIEDGKLVGFGTKAMYERHQ